MSKEPPAILIDAVLVPPPPSVIFPDSVVIPPVRFIVAVAKLEVVAVAIVIEVPAVDPMETDPPVILRVALTEVPVVVPEFVICPI
jgi:hypothetical protein